MKINIFKRFNKFNKMSRKKKIVTGIVILGVFFSIGSYIYSMNNMENKTPTVEIEKVEKGDLQTYIDTTGKIESLRIKKYFSPVNAKIKNVGFQEGGYVNSGDKVIEFDVTNLEKNNLKANLALKSGELGLADAVKKSNDADAKVNLAQSEINFYKTAVKAKKAEVEALMRKQDIENNRPTTASDIATLNTAVAELDMYESSLNGNIELYNAKISEINNLQAELDIASQDGNNDRYNHILGQIYNITGSMSSISQNNYDLSKKILDVKNAMDSLQKGVEASSSLRPNIETTIDLQNAQSELSELQGKLSTRESTVENATPLLTNLGRQQLIVENNLKELEVKDVSELIALGKKGIKNDFRGAIFQMNVAKDSEVTQGQELFTVYGLDDFIVKININKSDIRKIKTGQEAVVNIAGKDYKGKVRTINRIATKNEKGNTFITAIVSIDNPDESIFIGIDAKVKITAVKAENAILAPSGAINASSEGSFVYVLENGKIKKVNITTGISNPNKVEVLSGLKSGDAVITDIGELKAGDAAEGIGVE